MTFKAFQCSLCGILAAVLSASQPVRAEDSLRPKILVRPAAVVKGPEIHLGDIAEISASDPAFDRLVRDLKGLKLSDAAPPRTKTSIPGVKILEQISATGLDIQTVGYFIPQLVTVETAGRELSQAEVLTAARAMLAHDTSVNVQIRELNWDAAQIVPTGEANVEVQRLGLPAAGKLPLQVIVSVDGLPASRFLATAIVDDWREVPVLKKSLERGMLIEPDAVELVRLNLNQQPADVADDLGEVVGRRAKTRLEGGMTLRRSLIDIPPLVAKGKRITAVFEAGGLKATALGIALDDGLKGEVIKVRNESSKKVIKAKILSADEVEVLQQ